MKKFVLFVAVAALLSGCVRGYTPSMNTTDVTKVDFSESATWREGEACMTKILIFPPVGLASVKKAAEAGKISSVKLVDYNFQDYFFIQRGCVQVFGK